MYSYLKSPIVELVVGGGDEATTLYAHQGLLIQSRFFEEAVSKFSDDASVRYSQASIPSFSATNLSRRAALNSVPKTSLPLLRSWNTFTRKITSPQFVATNWRKTHLFHLPTKMVSHSSVMRASTRSRSASVYLRSLPWPTRKSISRHPLHVARLPTPDTYTPTHRRRTRTFANQSRHSGRRAHTCSATRPNRNSGLCVLSSRNSVSMCSAWCLMRRRSARRGSRQAVLVDRRERGQGPAKASRLVISLHNRKW